MSTDFFKQRIAPVAKLKRKLAGIGGSLTRKLRNEIGVRGMDSGGSLRRSIKHKTKFRAGYGGVQVSVTMEGYGGFINRNLYAKNPKMPNIEAIMMWMTTKGIEPNEGTSLKTAAYFIAKAISKNGYVVYNKHKKGWIDIVYENEIERLASKARKDVALAMKELSDLEFDWLKLKN